MKKILLAIFVSCCAVNAIAQDIHFSQFDASPANLNPAQTGVFDGDFRFIGNHRNQWSVIPVPYSTFSLAADMRQPIKGKSDNLGFGLVINSDKAGDADFSTKQVGFSFAYIKTLMDSAMFLSFGVQPGITNKSFQLSKLTFDSQYTGDHYDAAASSGETFNTTKLTYFDMSTGANLLYKIRPGLMVNTGFSFTHFTKPKQSFYNDSQIKLDPRLAFHASAQLPLSESLQLAPSLLFQKQGKFSELVAGTMFRFIIKAEDPETAFMVGGYLRAKDAVIGYAGFTMNRIAVGFSYDANTSGFVPATNKSGGYEISVRYILRKIVPYVAKKRVCPVYM
jgi:type IX secretion system PorP/SprF family membrane protein